MLSSRIQYIILPQSSGSATGSRPSWTCPEAAPPSRRDVTRGYPRKGSLPTEKVDKSHQQYFCFPARCRFFVYTSAPFTEDDKANRTVAFCLSPSICSLLQLRLSPSVCFISAARRETHTNPMQQQHTHTPLAAF